MIYLRQKNAALWLKLDGTFTQNKREAAPVESYAQALRLCRKHNLGAVDLIISRKNEPDTVVPLDGTSTGF